MEANRTLNATWHWPKWVTWALVLSPLGLLFDVLLLGAHVRLALGHWPKPMIENYSSPAFELHSSCVIVFGCFAAYVAIPLWLLLLAFRKFRVSARYHVIQIGVFLAGWCCIIGYLAWDPYRFVAWFKD